MMKSVTVLDNIVKFLRNVLTQDLAWIAELMTAFFYKRGGVVSQVGNRQDKQL